MTNLNHSVYVKHAIMTFSQKKDITFPLVINTWETSIGATIDRDSYETPAEFSKSNTKGLCL